jgi:glycosyltransferase involved in cell wall biosynthesis
MWVRLVKRCPGAHLVIVGPRRDRVDPAHREFQRRLEELCIASGAPQRVHFAGIVDNVEEYMRAADVLVFPSRREGMPNVVLEAMASRLPVLLTRFVGFPAELGEPGKQYVLADRDPDDLCSVVTRVLSETTLRENLADSGRKWVEEHMDVEQTLDQYAALYRATANEGSRIQPA